MRNLLLTLSYDGSGYHGWQIQENAPTVQEAFQAALYRATGLREDLKACSRTDTGVHAREFCVSLKTESRIPPQRLAAALNHYLPPDIAVKSCRPVPEDFHARYSCKGKEYCYEIWNHPVRDLEKGRVFITSQNHGYVVLSETVDPAVAEVSHVNVNDGTCEGLKYKRPRCFTTQFHPEANAGPRDTEYLFNRFVEAMGGDR